MGFCTQKMCQAHQKKGKFIYVRFGSDYICPVSGADRKWHNSSTHGVTIIMSEPSKVNKAALIGGEGHYPVL